MYGSSVNSKYTLKRKGSEVQVARGRLKVALQDIVENSDDDLETPQNQNMPVRGRPKKVIRSENAESEDTKVHSPGIPPAHESFIMKLFDRNLDLSKYDEHTPLYPICRAWIANTPRSPTIPTYRDRISPEPEVRTDNAIELLEKLRIGKISVINSMPAPLLTDLPRIPPPLFENEIEGGRRRSDLSLKGASRAQLLASYKQRWKKVRAHWKSHTRNYNEAKYKLNFELIEEMYKS